MKILYINGINYYYDLNWTILQFCFKNNLDLIPKFCYHEKLSIAGNCRMCLIEDIKSVKPVAACTVLLYSGIILYTNTIKVKKARESVLEFLLINHPLDRPICCQGGECDLQDLSEIFGGDKGRFYESKRAIINKNFGPFIKTIMNRCIHCTRCIRYAIEISGIFSLGIIGRGSKMEISSYIEQFFKSEISGNVIDLCPVGALTSKPYSFLARSWELQSFVTLNIYDIFLPNIRVDSRGGEILRILPKFNTIFNEEWISDDIRYCFDASKQQRLIYPLLFFKKLTLKISWRKIFFFIKEFFINSLIWLNVNKYKYLPFRIIIGSILDSQSIFLIKSFLNFGGLSININNTNNKYNFKNQYLLNLDFVSTLEKINYIIILGNNFRYTNPLVYLRMRKLFYEKSLIIYSFGFFSNINFYIKNLGINLSMFFTIFEGKNWISQFFLNNNIKVLVSSIFFGIMNYKIFYNFKFYINKFLIKKFSFDIHYISEDVSEISINHFGLVNSIHNQNCIFMPIYINYIIGFDKSSLKFVKSNKNLIIYQGHNADYSVNFSNLILPSSLFFELHDLTFINIFGLKKKLTKVSKSPIGTRTDFNILKSLSQYLGFYNLNQFHNFFKIKFNSNNNIYNYENKINFKIKYLSYIFNFFIKSFFFNHLKKNSLFNNSLNLKKSSLLFSKLNWKNN